jgi:nucleoside 2-deoxyribosyltransferase
VKGRGDPDSSQASARNGRHLAKNHGDQPNRHKRHVNRAAIFGKIDKLENDSRCEMKLGFAVRLMVESMALFQCRDQSRIRESQSLMRVYFAGPLFTQAERAWNRRIAEALTAAGHSVFLPQTEVQSIASLDANTIFELDVTGVRSAQAVVAILDGADPDSGTCFECGIAFALRIPIIAVRTDFRGGGDALRGQRLATVNLMLSQAAAAIVHLNDPANGPEVVASAVLAALERLG